MKCNKINTFLRSGISEKIVRFKINILHEKHSPLKIIVSFLFEKFFPSLMSEHKENFSFLRK